MKTKIPDALKMDVPQTKWGKILTATPVVMTVIATMLAGLSSSEMTRAQYNRSLATQLQSKAGDQWSFFQAKKLRGAMQRSTLDILKSTTAIRELDLDAMEKAGGIHKVTLATMANMLEKANQPVTLDSNITIVLKAIEHSKPENDIAELLKKVDDKSLAVALQTVRDRAAEFDADMTAVSPGFEEIEKQLTASDTPLARDFMVVRLGFLARRYDTEARLNQAIAGIYELQVRKSNIEAERHHQRSARFFYGMLAAQMGVIISTFSLAAQKRNWLWSFAAAAGLIAVSFAVYVYLWV